MIISRTPLRISFGGGGTDLEAFYAKEKEPGAVVSTGINKYIYIAVNRKFDGKIRASYSVTEIVDSVNELRHELIREALRMVGIGGGIEITSISDIPTKGTGLGSSSAYTVGLLNALYAYTGRLAGAERLAQEACQIEIDICGKPIGKQDQYIAAYGGLQYIEFNSNESVFVNPIVCSRETRERIVRESLLLYSGLTRSADQILSKQSENTVNRVDVREGLRTMKRLADRLRDAFVSGNLAQFGEVLHKGWLEKRKLAYNISNPAIDYWYETALRHGAIGGKVLGAGGGGFLLFYAPVERHKEILDALPDLKPVPFRFEPQGSKIIYVEENED